ncbi:MAG: tRNA uridine-5-carboxymethylaminomethyl(34) synthesis GTPase MnmE [Candidatus Bipolaricaulota bacterium]|nr:tRNA uridine-5-carboxymethylaminomethyl(34) synthesis GTPase MnmE [Candidatus Bipolaricaulota bacterium]
MHGAFSGDTIVAISTPLGEGGIGIVRLSGPRAVRIVEAIFQPAKETLLSQAPTHTIYYGHIVSDGERVDEVLVSVMHPPHTYTREEIVEINCHGGIVATRAVLDLVLAHGARLAERGEFTKRAFLNGRISLDQAKAVADVVSAKTKLGLEAAVDQLGGRFSRAIAAIREDLAALLAEIEVEIDFPDVDAEAAPLLPRLIAQGERVRRLIAQGEQGRVVREGLTVAIIGRPNVGKSTLLNAILSEERAIVTEIPGTTRDTVEEEAVIGGIPARLIDTAGLRKPTDPVEAEGVKRAEDAVVQADLLLLVLDRSALLTTEDRNLLARDWDRPLFLILNKSDLPRRLEPLEEQSEKPIYEISAKEQDGIELLTKGILDSLVGGNLPTRNTVLLLDTWERDLLRRVDTSLTRAGDAVRDGLSPDMIGEELRDAYTITGELQGIDVSEEVLDQLFRRFCVGK